MNDPRSRAAEESVSPRRIMLVVVEGSIESLDDASKIGNGSRMPESVADEVSIVVFHSVDDAFAIWSAAACSAATDGSIGIVSVVRSGAEMVASVVVAAGSKIGSGSVTGTEEVAAGGVDVADDAGASVEEVAAVGSGDGVAAAGACDAVCEFSLEFEFEAPATAGTAASCRNAEFPAPNAPAGARYERSCVSALSGWLHPADDTCVGKMCARFSSWKAITKCPVVQKK